MCCTIHRLFGEMMEKTYWFVRVNFSSKPWYWFADPARAILRETEWEMGYMMGSIVVLAMDEIEAIAMAKAKLSQQVLGGI